MKAGQAFRFAKDSPARVPAFENLVAGCFHEFLAFLGMADVLEGPLRTLDSALLVEGRLAVPALPE